MRMKEKLHPYNDRISFPWGTFLLKVSIKVMTIVFTTWNQLFWRIALNKVLKGKISLKKLTLGQTTFQTFSFGFWHWNRKSCLFFVIFCLFSIYTRAPSLFFFFITLYWVVVIIHANKLKACQVKSSQDIDNKKKVFFSFASVFFLTIATKIIVLRNL